MQRYENCLARLQCRDEDIIFDYNDTLFGECDRIMEALGNKVPNRCIYQFAFHAWYKGEKLTKMQKLILRRWELIHEFSKVINDTERREKHTRKSKGSNLVFSVSNQSETGFE